MAMVHSLFSVTLAKQYTQRRTNRPASDAIRRLQDASTGSSDSSRRHRDRGNSVDDDTSYQLPLMVVQAYQRLLSSDNSVLLRKSSPKDANSQRKSTTARPRLASVAERSEQGDSSLDMSSSRDGLNASSPKSPAVSSSDVSSTSSTSTSQPAIESRASQASVLTLVAEDNIRTLVVQVQASGREVLQLANREALNELQRRIIDNIRRLFSEAYNYLAAAMRSNAIMGLVREALAVLQWLCMQHARSMPSRLQQHLLQVCPWLAACRFFFRFNVFQRVSDASRLCQSAVGRPTRFQWLRLANNEATACRTYLLHYLRSSHPAGTFVPA
jgi:hypothetical protein